MTNFEYWRPQPKRHDFMWWALLLPAIIYASGVIVYAHAAFSPADIATNGHAIGSALMVIGGEIGTLAAAAEVFRKSQTDPVETNVLDWLGLLVSLVATLGNLFVVYSVIDANLDTEWIRLARRFGPLALLLCSGLDFYAGIMEFGFYNAIFDERMEAWLLSEHNARLRWERRGSADEAQPDAKQAQLEEYMQTQSEAQSEEVPLERLRMRERGNEEGDGETQSEHECEYCGRTFGSPQAVSAHLRFCDARKRKDGDV